MPLATHKNTAATEGLRSTNMASHEHSGVLIHKELLLWLYIRPARLCQSQVLSSSHHQINYCLQCLCGDVNDLYSNLFYTDLSHLSMIYITTCFTLICHMSFTHQHFNTHRCLLDLTVVQAKLLIISPAQNLDSDPHYN